MAGKPDREYVEARRVLLDALVSLAPHVLLVSKLHKIGEREDQPERLADKDALDVFRLLRGIEDLKRELCLAERARANAGAVVRVSRVPIVIVRGPLA